MNSDNKSIRFTVIGGLAILLLALVIVLMANPAAASGSGDWPPPAFGDWVINQPTTVIDESWVFLSDQNIIVNSDLTVYNSYIYMDSWSWPTLWSINVAKTGTLEVNESTFDCWDSINVRIDGEADIRDTTFYWTQDFNVSGSADFYECIFYYNFGGMNLMGSADFELCTFSYFQAGVYVSVDDVGFTDSEFYRMYNKGLYLDNCDPTFWNVSIWVYSGTYRYYTTTDEGWDYDNRFPVAIGTAIWVDGGNPSFTDVDVEADTWGEFHIEYTGTEEDVTVYVMGVACPVLIDSPGMTTVSGLTVHDSSYGLRSYFDATDPGTNPRYFYGDFMGASAGIGVINYLDTTITDVEAWNNQYYTIDNPVVSGYSQGGSGWYNYGPRVNIGAGIVGAFSSSISPVLTLKDMTVNDGTNWFGHMYYPTYTGTGVPVFDDTVLIQNVDVTANRATIFTFDIRPGFEDKRKLNIDIRITDCTFSDMDERIMYYYAQAGPGIDPNVNMIDVTEDILIDNNTFTMGWYYWTYFYIETVWNNHMSDPWDRTVTFADNDFVDSWGTLFYANGLGQYSRGSCTLNVLNNNFDNLTDDDNGNGPYYGQYFDTIRFVGNDMTDMYYGVAAEFYDSGGDPTGINPVDWLFKDNTIVNCTAEEWDEIFFMEFGGKLVVQGNDVSMGSGFLSMYHVTEWTGTASLDIIENDFHDMGSYIAEFGNVDEGNLYFTVTVKDNHVYNCEDFFLDYYGNSQTITSFDRDATFIIEDNIVQNNTGGFVNIWGDVTVQNNDFWDNEGPILAIDYINLNTPTVVNNNLNNNVDLYEFVAKDRGFQLIPMKLSNEALSCTGTALSFTNMEITLDHVDITGASEPIWVMNSIVDIFSSTVDGNKCTVEAKGSITTWWPLEAKVTWADANGVDSETPVAYALMVFYDANDDYYTSTYADADGMLSQALYKEWMVAIDGLLEYSPYSMKASSSGATEEVMVNLTSELIGDKMIEMLLWDIFEPIVAITEPYNGAVFSKNSVEVYGFVAEVGSGLGPIEYSVDGGEWMTLTISPNGDWTVPLTDLADGDRTLAVQARDIASNLATTSVTITIDSVAPDLTIGNTPSATNNPDLVISGTIEEGVELFVDGMSHGIVDSSLLMIMYLLHEGDNIILIEAVDTAKNTAFQTVEVTLDTQPPVLVVTGPARSMVTNEDTVTVLGIVEGHEDLTVGGTPVIADEDGSFSHVVTLTAGENVIEVKAIDWTTNVATTTLNIELDQDPPTVEISDPDTGYKTSDGIVEITILSDPDTMLKINGRPTTNDEGNTIRTVLLLEGLNIITVTGRDPAGNDATDSIEVFLDTMPPVLRIDSPAVSVVWTNSLTLSVEGFAFNATEVTINGEAADSFNVGTGAFSHSASLTNGENNITIEAKDEVNTVTAFRKAWISTSAPKLVVDSVTAVVTTPSVTISGETEAGIPTVYVEVGGTTREFPVRYDGVFEFTLNFDDGNYDVEVSVDDIYGNTNSQQTGSFKVNQESYFPDGGGEEDDFQIEPIHIGLILAVIGITLIVAAFLAVSKISRREE